MPFKKKSQRVSPKIVPIAGTLEFKSIRCGRTNCRCVRGELHGEYAYLRIQVNGHRYRRYIKKEDLPNVIEGINAYHSQKAQARFESEDFQQKLAKFREKSKSLQIIIREYLKSVGIK